MASADDLALRRSLLEELRGNGSPEATDPVGLVRGYRDPLDQEIAGLIAACLAYGQVMAMCRTIRGVLDALGPSPRTALLEGRHRSPGWSRGFRYRFTARADLLALLDGAAGMIEAYGSLGAALARQRHRSGSLEEALGAWVGEFRARAADPRRARRRMPQPPAEMEGRRPAGGRVPRLSRGLRHLLPDPARGGACKRWWLYLRWMIREEDGIDPGPWARLFSPSELRLPLDVHWIRIGRRLGWTRRATPDAKMAAEITSELRRIAEHDPLRYDFAVCHFGISGGCPPRLTPSHCRSCRLRPVCASTLARGPL